MKRAERELDALYAELPKLECQGLCHSCCGPIDMSTAERERIGRKTGKQVRAPKGTCSMLFLGRCSVYKLRPMICRLWGLVEGMECPYGCKPERWLTEVEGYHFLGRAYKIGGGDEKIAGVTPEIIEAAISTKEGRRLLRRIVQPPGIE